MDRWMERWPLSFIRPLNLKSEVAGLRECAGPKMYQVASDSRSVSVTTSKAEASLNPGAVNGHIGIDTWTVGQGTTFAPAHHACQDPAPRLQAGQGSPRVTL